MKLANDLIWFLSAVYPTLWIRYDKTTDSIIMSPKRVGLHSVAIFLVLDETGKQYPDWKNNLATLDSGAKIKAQPTVETPTALTLMLSIGTHIYNFLVASKRITPKS